MDQNSSTQPSVTPSPPQPSPPQPSVEPTPPQQNEVSQPPAKKSKKVLILLAILFVVIIGSVGAWLLLGGKNSMDTTQNQPSIPASNPETLAEVVSEFDRQFLAQNPEYKTFSSSDNDRTPASVPIFSDDINYLVDVEDNEIDRLQYEGPSSTESDEDGDGVFDEPTAAYEQAESTAKAILGSLGFTDFDNNGLAELLNSDGTSERFAYMSRDQFVCSIAASSFVYVNCVDVKDLANEAKEILPFYEAYSKSLANDPDNEYEIDRQRDIVSISEIVKNDKYEEYEIARGGIGSLNGGGAAAFFYRKDAGDWVFAFGRQSIMGCNDYNTEDLQKAFYDDECVPDETLAPSETNEAVTVEEYYSSN